MREYRVISGSKFMPNAASLCDVHIPDGCAIRFSADDIRNSYHAFPGTLDRAQSTPVGYAYPAEAFAGWNCFRDDLPSGELVYMCWSGLGMGDHNACDWAEEGHINVLLGCGVLGPEHWLIYPRCLPYNSDGYYEGVMIDDRIGIQIYSTGDQRTQWRMLLLLNDRTKRILTRGLNDILRKKSGTETMGAFGALRLRDDRGLLVHHDTRSWH